ncbi:MAG: 1-phosphofructokinase [Bacillaceae bacterium]
MIYTVTLNPSIDYIVHVSDFKEEGINRIESDVKYPGGKGINVSRVLHRLGANTKALGFIGGFTGGFIYDTLTAEGIKTDFICVEGDTRINVKLKSTHEAEINGQGPTITQENLEELMQKLDDATPGSIVVLAGSIPNSVPSDLYETLTARLTAKGLKVVVDASGKALLGVVKHKPFFVKPNHHELAELFDVELTSLDDIITYGRKLVDMGAQHVVVSMAGNGALLLTKEHTYVSNVPKGKVVNSVGAGDSLVAGFLGTYEKTQDVLKSFQYAVATGSATAFSSDLAEVAYINELVKEVKVQQR